MKNFQKLSENVEVAFALNEVMRQPDLWNAHPVRTMPEISPHRQAEDILLRFNVIADVQTAALINDIECVNYPAMYQLPSCRNLIMSLMAKVQGEQLGRCMVTKLKPGSRITPHRDMGAPATYYDRYHVVLQSAPGCVFRSGQETVYMRTGEVWWFDNATDEHEVLNNSAEDRIHLIADIRTFK